MAELPDDIARINALTTNARNTWFALLGVLVFISITLVGSDHIDFYGVDRDTKLPLVDVEVPTRYFFIAAPVLTTAIYGYFHLYLIRLWDVLGDAPPRIGGVRLGDAISPWLVSDAALHFRNRIRKDNCTKPRTLEGASMLLNIALAWVFGLVILYFLWQQSMPARAFELTMVPALAFAVALVVGASSIAMMVRRMWRVSDGTPPNLWATPMQLSGLAIGAAALLFDSYENTEGSAGRLAPLTMIDEDIVVRPAGWLPYQMARKEFRVRWCAREKLDDCTDVGGKEQQFTAEWQTHRRNKLNDMLRSDWHKIGRDKPDFRGAALNASFLVGADLSSAKMAGANLSGAQVEGADLRKAQMERTNLKHARMEGANLRKAEMANANLSYAQMHGANLTSALMQRTVLKHAHMAGADLRRAQMDGADLSGAQMEGTDFRFTQLEGAILDYSYLSGQRSIPVSLKQTNLKAATNHGGALRYVDFSSAEFDARTDFRNAFMDGSVQRPDAFDAQMGRPCQWWPEEITDDAEFYGRWRGWIRHETSPAKKTWKFMAPEGWRHVDPIAPPEGCVWKTDPLPAAKD